MNIPIASEEKTIAQEHLSYGKVYLDQGETEHAIDEFNVALTHDPGSVEALIELGKAHLSIKQCDKSAEFLERALSMYPNYADLHYYLGCTYIEMDQKERAINEFKEALNINPRYAAARNTLGRVMKIFSRAPKNAEAPDRSDDDNEARLANTHFHLGNALLQKNLLQEAVIEYKEAIRLRPNYPDVRNKIGELYMRRGLYNLAEEEFLLALKINPKFIAALLNLAETYRFHSEQLLEKAEAAYQQILEVDSDNDKARHGLEKVQSIKNLDFV